MSWIRRKLWVLAVGVLAGASGCNPFTLGLLTPIPVQPWVAERMDQKLAHKNDGRVPIMPPLRAGYPDPICEDAPSDQEVLRAMPRVPRGVPYIYETFRDDIVIVKNRLVDKIDPPRFFPLVGQAQLVVELLGALFQQRGGGQRAAHGSFSITVPTPGFRVSTSGAAAATVTVSARSPSWSATSSTACLIAVASRPSRC